MKFYHLCGWSAIHLSGEKTRDFLQGQITADINSLSEQHPIYAAHCDRKGRVQSLFWLITNEQGIYMITPATVAEHCHSQLKRFAQFSRVNCQLTETPVYLCQATQGHTEPPLALAIDQQGYSFAVGSTNDNNDELSTEAFDAILVNNGVPRLYPETLGQFLPHSINLPQLSAVSFTKGCYIGQEIIARMEHRGKAKYHMVKQQHDEWVSPGKKSEQVNGTCVTCATVGDKYCSLVVRQVR